MRLHERYETVARAHLDATGAVLRIFSDAGLSYGEVVAWHASELSSNAKYMIRQERHGDASYPGDEE